MNTLSQNTQAVLKTLVYFDLFKFPLTKAEVLKFCTVKLKESEVAWSLNELLSQGFIKQKQNYYLLSGSPDETIHQRQENEKNAAAVLPLVMRYSRIISGFPFVEAVCISGSYSKGLHEKDGDIDYFIICRPGRLWVCRSLLVIFKKTFLLNSKKYFCVNYFIDTNHLAIPDCNLYTATEIATLLPAVNFKLFNEFISANTWVNDQFPNLVEKRESSFYNPQRNLFKRLAEWMFKGKAGEKLDNFFFRLTLNTWKKKFPGFNSEEFDLNMRSKKGVSKHHPRGFQHKVLGLFEEKLKSLQLHEGLESHGD